MDQMACSIGQPDLMLFLDTMTMERRLVPLAEAAEILVIDSGIPRELAGTQYTGKLCGRPIRPQQAPNVPYSGR